MHTLIHVQLPMASLLRDLIVVSTLMCFTKNCGQLLHSNAQGCALWITPALVSSAGGCCNITLGSRCVKQITAHRQSFCVLCAWT